MEEYVEYLSHSPGDTARIAAEVTSRLKAGDIILYEGDMGAGKPLLQRESRRRLVSPTRSRVRLSRW